MNKKQTEHIATIALAAFLTGYFVYQVAYGMPMTMGPNGTMTMTQGNITAQFNAPHGNTVSNVTITPLPHMVDLIGTWHFGAADRDI